MQLQPPIYCSDGEHKEKDEISDHHFDWICGFQHRFKICAFGDYGVISG
jgi:hypothetical protein